MLCFGAVTISRLLRKAPQGLPRTKHPHLRAQAGAWVAAWKPPPPTCPAEALLKLQARGGRPSALGLLAGWPFGLEPCQLPLSEGAGLGVLRGSSSGPQHRGFEGARVGT